MTIREAIRAYIDEQGDALDPEWLIHHVATVVEDELTEAGWECDDETLEWTQGETQAKLLDAATRETERDQS